MCALESVSYDMQGLEALIFTAEGDMRNALNGLQSTVSGFGHVSAVNVFKVHMHVAATPTIINNGLYLFFAIAAARCAISPTP